MPLDTLISTNDFKDWRNDANVQTTVAHKIDNAIWQNSPWDGFIGPQNGRIIKTFKAEHNGPYRIRLTLPLLGEGVTGNANFDTNRDQMVIVGQTIEPEIFKNSLASDDKKYERLRDIDFLAQATDQLTDWMMVERDRRIFAALYNDPSNCVIANDTANLSTAGSVTDAVQQLNAGDKLTVKTLQRAISAARVGKLFNGGKTLPVQYAKIETRSNGGVSFKYGKYIILLSSYQVEQLRADPLWQQMQLNAAARGANNAMFSGALGEIEGCPVFDMGVMQEISAGMIDSSIDDAFYKRCLGKAVNNYSQLTPPSMFKCGDGTDTACGFLLGANALACAGINGIDYFINEKEDMGAKIAVGVSKMMALAKIKIDTRAAQAYSKYAGADLSVMSIFSAIE